MRRCRDRSDKTSKQVLLRPPGDLLRRLKKAVLARECSAFVRHLLDGALSPTRWDHNPSYLATLTVERDTALTEEIGAWQKAARSDGLTVKDPVLVRPAHTPRRLRRAGDQRASQTPEQRGVGAVGGECQPDPAGVFLIRTAIFTQVRMVETSPGASTRGVRALARFTKPRTVAEKTVKGINFFEAGDAAMLHALQNPKVTIAGIRPTDLLSDLEMFSPSRLSRHLRRLLDIGVIKRIRGTYRYYLAKAGRGTTAATERLAQGVIVPTVILWDFLLENVSRVRR